MPPRESYRAVVEFWPLTGWLTGGVMAAVLLAASVILPYHVAVPLAVASRLLLTGAFHEDGLADFFDGFGGGGNDRERILAIMKDSRTGSYGVIGTVVYLLILTACLYSLPPYVAAFTVLAGDPFAKMVAGQLIMMLPYARKEEEAKAKTIYRKMSVPACVGLAVQGLVPIAAYVLFLPIRIEWAAVLFMPCIVMYLLYLLLRRTLHGYTGDCCGAVFLLVELAFYLAVAGSVHYGSTVG